MRIICTFKGKCLHKRGSDICSVPEDVFLNEGGCPFRKEEKEEMIDQTYKHDKDKPRLDLVPPGIIEAVGVIRSYGVEKYGENTNWDKVDKSRYKAALMRHLCEYLRNENSIDEESGLLHLWHMACNIAFLCELQKWKA